MVVVGWGVVVGDCGPICIEYIPMVCFASLRKPEANLACWAPWRRTWLLAASWRRDVPAFFETMQSDDVFGVN